MNFNTESMGFGTPVATLFYGRYEPDMPFRDLSDRWVVAGVP
jgi:hypothetical protein